MQTTQAASWTPLTPVQSAPGPGGQPVGQGRERLPLFQPAVLSAARLEVEVCLVPACLGSDPLVHEVSVGAAT